MTTEGDTRLLERPFIVLATQNPIEHEGTYPLPEAQLDRFLLRISVGYPSREDEIGILEQRRDRRTDDVELDPVVDGETLRAMQRALEDVHVSGADRLLHRRRRPRDARGRERPGRGEPARDARDPEARARAGRARRPRLRRPRRRQGGRRPGARAPALAPARALGAAGARGGRRRRAARDRADPAGRGAVTRGASPKAAAYAALGGLALLAALVAAAAGARRARRAVSAPARRRAASPAGDPDLRASVRVDRDRVLEGDEVSSRSSWRPSGRSRAPRCCSSCRRAWPSSTATTRSPSGSRALARTVLPFGCGSSAGAPTRGRRADAARPRLARPLQPHRPGRRGIVRSRSYPTPRGAAPPAPPGETQLYSGDELSRHEGRGHRVRRPPPVRLRRPHAPDQLARERAPRRAVGERAAPGAEHGRRPLPRQLRRRPARPVEHLDLAVRAAATLAERYIRRRDRVGLVSFGGYVRWLAPGSGMAQPTGSSTRCSTRRSRSATRGRRSTSSRPGRCRRRRS